MKLKAFYQKYKLIILPLLYLIWPIDLIPELMGPVGLVDDASVLFGTIIIGIIKSLRK